MKGIYKQTPWSFCSKFRPDFGCYFNERWENFEVGSIFHSFSINIFWLVISGSISSPSDSEGSPSHWCVLEQDIQIFDLNIQTAQQRRCAYFMNMCHFFLWISLAAMSSIASDIVTLSQHPHACIHACICVSIRLPPWANNQSTQFNWLWHH